MNTDSLDHTGKAVLDTGIVGALFVGGFTLATVQSILAILSFIVAIGLGFYRIYATRLEIQARKKIYGRRKDDRRSGDNVSS